MAFSDVLRRMRDAVLNNKLITFLSVALFAFVIATIALAGENNSNADALAECRGKLWHATSVAPPSETTTSVPVDPNTTTEPAATSTVVGESTTAAGTTLPSEEPPAPESKFLVTHNHEEQIRRR